MMIKEIAGINKCRNMKPPWEDSVVKHINSPQTVIHFHCNFYQNSSKIVPTYGQVALKFYGR